MIVLHNGEVQCTYKMLLRFIEQQQAVCAVLLDGTRDDRQPMPTDQEISIAEEMVTILKSFDDATEIMSGENIPPLEY